MPTQEQQNQADLGKWKDSTITLMGDEKKSRPSMGSSIIKGLIFVILAKSALGLHHRHHPTAIPQHSYSYNYVDAQQSHHSENMKLVESMDVGGKTINKVYGEGNTVFIWENDTQLQDVLQKTNPKFLEYMPTVSMKSGFRDFKDNAIDDHKNHGQVLKDNAYDNLKSDSLGNFSWSAGRISDSDHPDVKDRIVLLKTSNFESELSSSGATYPRHASSNELQYGAFFDAVIRATTGHSIHGQNVNKDVSEISMLDNSEKDTAMSLIALKQTGNKDEWNLNLKAQRMTDIANSGKMGVETTDKILSSTSYDDVKNLSDLEIIHLAQKKTFDAEIDRPGPMYAIHNVDHARLSNYTHLIYSGKNQDERTVSDAIYAANRLSGGNAMQLVKDYSLGAMEASMNSLAYHGKLDADKSDFVSAVKDHIEKYNDGATADALKVAQSGGSFDYKTFATQMNMKVDFDSHARLEGNTNKMMSYMNEVTGKATPELKTASLDTNLSSSVQERYALKASQAVKADKVNTVEFSPS